MRQQQAANFALGLASVAITLGVFSCTTFGDTHAEPIRYPKPDPDGEERERQRRGEDQAILDHHMVKARGEDQAPAKLQEEALADEQNRTDARMAEEAARAERELAEDERIQHEERAMAEAAANDPASPDIRIEFAERYERNLLAAGFEIHDATAEGDMYDVLYLVTPNCTRQLVYKLGNGNRSKLKGLGFVAVMCESPLAQHREDL